jgi:hypothetical protein
MAQAWKLPAPALAAAYRPAAPPVYQPVGYYPNAYNGYNPYAYGYGYNPYAGYGYGRPAVNPAYYYGR